MSLDDIAGEHHVGIGHMDHCIARGMGAAKLEDIDPAVAKENAHAAIESGGGPSQAGDAFVPLEKARKALKLTVPVFLPAFGHHVAGRFGHDDLARAEGACPQHPHGVVMRQHDMGNRLVGHPTDAVDHLLRQTRGCLRLDNHDAFITDDDARVRVTLGGKGVKTFADFDKADPLVGHVTLRRECLCHVRSFCKGWPARGSRSPHSRQTRLCSPHLWRDRAG